MSIIKQVEKPRMGTGSPGFGPRYRRDFSQEHRLTCRSLPEICERVKREVARVAMTRQVTFRGRKLTNEAFLNAAALYLSELDRDSQAMILDAYITRIEIMMEGDAPTGPGTTD